jgi:glucose-1-phosphate thymidylyltransferase
LLVLAGSMSKTGYGQYLARLINDDVLTVLDGQRLLKGAA